MSDEPLLAVDSLVAGYGDGEVLTGVTFEVPEGEVVALLGRNGVGKTTTLRCIVGSLPVTSGTITFRGEDIADQDVVERVRTGITLVPENRRIFPDLTVAENLRLGQYGGEVHRTELTTIEEIYDLFDDLANRREQLAGTLSGGEQQMLALAQALLTGADLLMLDEPTEGLAPTIVEELVEVVEHLQATGCTLLVVEQNLGIALEFADTNYVIDKGTVVFEGDSETLQESEDVIDRYLSIDR